MNVFQRATDPPLRLLVNFQQIFPDVAPEWIVQAPGREMWAAAALHQRNQFTLIAPDLEGETTFSLRSAKARRTVMNRPLPDWARYPAAVVVALCHSGLDVAGLDAIIVGEEPPGPRYHYGLGIAIAALWHELHGRTYTADSLLAIVEQVRRDYIEA
jgi:galactokinase